MKIIATTLAVALILGNIGFASSDDLPPSYTPSLHQIIVKQAKVYSAPIPLMRSIIMCESSNNPNAWNKSDPNGGSKGLFQFQTSTFNNYAKKIGIQNPDIWDKEQQVSVGAYMIANGQIGQWSCAKKLHLIK